MLNIVKRMFEDEGAVGLINFCISCCYLGKCGQFFACCSPYKVEKCEFPNVGLCGEIPLLGDLLTSMDTILRLLEK